MNDMSAIQIYQNQALREVTMRQVRASDAESQLPSLLDAVERGETVIITRDGRPIARIIPEADRHQAQVAQVFAEIEEFRKTMPRISLEEILSARHGGHKY
jgi:prevent-host-death family protein